MNNIKSVELSVEQRDQLNNAKWECRMLKYVPSAGEKRPLPRWPMDMILGVKFFNSSRFIGDGHQTELNVVRKDAFGAIKGVHTYNSDSLNVCTDYEGAAECGNGIHFYPLLPCNDTLTRAHTSDQRECRLIGADCATCVFLGNGKAKTQSILIGASVLDMATLLNVVDNVRLHYPDQLNQFISSDWFLLADGTMPVQAPART